jgi:hypothetical protein
MSSGKIPNLGGLFGYAQEIVRFQAGSADQSSINLGLCHKLGNIVSGNTATIQNTDVIGNIATVLVRD